MTHTYTISGMTCKNCTARVRSELLKLRDVTSADIQLESPQATITMTSHIATDVLQNAVAKAGTYRISPAGNTMMEMSMDQTEKKNSYFPIVLIFGYIAGGTLLIQAAQGSFHWMQWMQHFMAGFFMVFSFFKLMNLRGFAEGYESYDIVARHMPAWGFIYPFVELALGISFLTGFQPLGTNIVALVIMAISSIGVIQSLVKKQTFQCACLGTVIRLPLSKVTLTEDLLMVVMSGIMVVSMS